MNKFAMVAGIEVMHALSWLKDGGGHKARNVGGLWWLRMTPGQ